MTTPAELMPVFREMLSLHEALRNLGFAAADIYVCMNATDAKEVPLVGLTLQTQGRALDFEVDRLPPPLTLETFVSGWASACQGVNSGAFAEEDLQAMYRASFVCRHAEVFVARLLRYGFTFPRGMLVTSAGTP